MTRIFVLLAVCTLSGLAHADNWPHWRGPNGNGAAQGKPPTSFSDSVNVKWRVAVPGASSGSPVVWDNQVFIVTSIPQSQPRGLFRFEVHCYDRGNGEQLWKRIAAEAVPHQETHNTNTHASASPCTDGQHVYAHFGSRGTYCYTMDGQLKWKRDLGDMNTRNGFGEGSSPTLLGSMLIVPWDHEGSSALFALDKMTGEIVWKADRDEPTCWATPLVVQHQGQPQIVMNGQNAVRAYDAQSGRELWSCGGQTERPCASAVWLEDTVFVGSGYRGAFLGAFKLGGQGNIARTKQVRWTIDHDTPDVASPLLSGTRLYFYKARTGQLSCLDALTGKPHYVGQRIPGISSTYASPVAAGGKVYLTDRNGAITVISDADKLSVLATNKLEEGVDATPAIADDQLFIRTSGHLLCVAE